MDLHRFSPVDEPREWQRFPPDLALSETWPSLTDRVEGLTEELEEHFRQGAYIEQFMESYPLVTQDHCSTGNYGREGYEAYLRWREIEGWPLHPGDHEKATLEELESWLASWGIRFKAGEKHGPCSHIAHQIFEVLPQTFLKKISTGNKALFQELEFSGTDGGVLPITHGSEYVPKTGQILIYGSVANRGMGNPRRFTGTLLHELGHVAEEILKQNSILLTELEEAHEIIRQNQAFLGTSFGFGCEATRRQYQETFGEFLAETFMIYISQGPRLRMLLDSLDDATTRQAWLLVYHTYLHKVMSGTAYC